MTEKEPFVYSGHDNLLAMQHAKNYNRFLAGVVRQYGEGLGRVADFGAGIGAFASTVREWAPELICIEPDESQAAILMADGFHVASDVSELDDDSVGYVYSLNVFEHIEGDERIMRALLGKLREGGRLLVYVPALSWLYSSMDRRVGHVRRYHLGELTGKLTKAGYRIRKAEYVDSLGVLATLAYKMSGNEGGDVSVPSLKVYDRFVFPVSRVMDLLFKRLLGKNLLVVAEKP